MTGAETKDKGFAAGQCKQILRTQKHAGMQGHADSPLTVIILAAEQCKQGPKTQKAGVA